MPNMKEIRAMARQLGIRSTQMQKDDLIRAIQRAEGNFDCYGTAVEGECDQEECLWREDCFIESIAEEYRR
jgi:Rho termination factor, N-terminal domain